MSFQLKRWTKYCPECHQPMQYHDLDKQYVCISCHAAKAEKEQLTFRPQDLEVDFSQALNPLCVEFHLAARARGFYSDVHTGKPIERNVGEQIAQMHSELSEMLEGHRKNKMDDHLPHRKSIEVEAADLVIRLFDFCGYHELDLSGAVREKSAYNARRADHDIANRAKADGKKY